MAAGSPPPRYRRSPHLVFYWRGTDFVVQNYATGALVGVRPLVVDILEFFDTWRTGPELFAARPRLSRRSLELLLRVLVKRSLLQDNRDRLNAAERAMEAWADWNPPAGFFHTATRDVHFADVQTIERLERERARSSPLPDPLKRYTGARRTRLPAVDVRGEFPDVLRRRRTWRRFDRRPIPLASLSTVLGLTGGVQSWVNATNDKKLAIKTSPSGGARHSIELYVLALAVKSLRRGLYHYAPDTHALDLISHKASRSSIAHYLPAQFWFKGAAAVVFFAAVYPRELWRYTHPRAYRAVLIEAGHLCQTFCLTATWLNLAPFCTMALADSRIEKDLRLDGISESVLYAAGVGSRPRNVEWVPPQSANPPATLSRHQLKVFPGRIDSRTRTRGR